MFLELLLLAQSVDTIAVRPSHVDGSHLEEGRSCYDIFLGDDRIGGAVQTVQGALHEGEEVWNITIYQSLPARAFQMRDEFVVKQSDLLPLSLVSERGADRDAPGWQRVSISYEGSLIKGTRETRGGIVPIRAESGEPVWDGNLWGPLFASLPLAPGSHFVVPMWQYDKGFGQFEVRVAGSGPVSHPEGTREAWLLDAGTDPDRLARYAIARSSREELSYGAGPMQQVLSENCMEHSEAR